MSTIFLSHSSKDNFEAVALRDWLAEEGWNDIFLDLDPSRGISAGERWERALHEAATRCEAVVFLVSGGWLASGWCMREYTLARTLNKTLLAVLVDSALRLADLPPELTDSWQVVDLTGGQDGRLIRVTTPGSHEEKHVVFSKSGLTRLKRGLEKAGLDPKFFAWPPLGEPARAPYRGLKPLDVGDAGVFFGRDAPIVEAVDRLRRLQLGAPPRLLAIIGASGAGKSSFLRAGLLPRLTREDRQFAVLKPVRPERAALTGEQGLLSALEAAFPQRTRGELRAAMTGGASTLRPLLASLTARPNLSGDGSELRERRPAVVIAIDQAEELFRDDGGSESADLLEIIRALSEADDPPVLTIFAIRADSYDALERAKPFEGMPQAAMPLLPMPRAAYAEVIEGPARRVREAGGRLTIDPLLTSRLLQDIEQGAGADALPLLAVTLEELYLEVRQSGAPRLADYLALGELRGAIDAAVGRALKRADASRDIPRDRAGREAALRRGFIPWLAGVDPDTRAVRRNIADYSDIPDDAKPLLDLLVEERLLSTDVRRELDPATGRERRVKTIEPAHEALLRNWSVLADWLAADITLLSTLEEVKRAATVWRDRSEEPGWLTHLGLRLAEARQLDVRPDIAARLGDLDRRYLAACQSREDAERRAREEAQAREEAHREQRVRDAEAIAVGERRVAQRTRRGLVASLVFLAAALGAAVFAFSQWRVAQHETDAAIAAREDSAQVARLARSELSEVNFELGQRIEDLLRWLPPAWRATLHHWRAGTHQNARDFASERRDLDAELAEDPGYVPTLIASSDNFNMIGDSERSIRDAGRALALGSRDAVVYANLALAEAMARDYDQALAHIEAALSQSPRMIDVTESLLADDLQGFTSGFKLRIRDTDFLIALRYAKAVIVAMRGGDLTAALAEADGADRAQAFASRSSYLEALNWEWLILRGQALAETRLASAASPTSPTPRDYGAFAAEAALWARVAATRGEYSGRAAVALDKFQAADKAQPRADYRGLADWAAAFAKQGPLQTKASPSPLGEARDDEVRAIEWADGFGVDDPYRAAPALDRLSKAIALLDPARLKRPLDRREEDALIDLRLRRGAWRLTAGDRGGAADDARRVIAIDAGVAGAYVLLGEALTAQTDRRAAYEHALQRDPSAVGALDGLASKLPDTSAAQALDLLQREGHFKRFDASDWARLAALSAQLGKSTDALKAYGVAIEMAPTEADLYAARRQLDGPPASPEAASVSLARDMHDRARSLAQAGEDGAALGAYMTAVHALSEAQDKGDAGRELESVLRDFDQFLARRYGANQAQAFWRALAQSPAASEGEKRIAGAEASRP